MIVVTTIISSFFQTLRSSESFGTTLFALNITRDDYESLSKEGLVSESNSYPIIRARITHINDTLL